MNGSISSEDLAKYGISSNVLDGLSDDKKGSIADGKDADIVLLDAENDIADVFVGGNLIER